MNIKREQDHTKEVEEKLANASDEKQVAAIAVLVGQLAEQREKLEFAQNA